LERIFHRGLFVGKKGLFPKKYMLLCMFLERIFHKGLVPTIYILICMFLKRIYSLQRLFPTIHNKTELQNIFVFGKKVPQRALSDSIRNKRASRTLYAGLVQMSKLRAKREKRHPMSHLEFIYARARAHTYTHTHHTSHTTHPHTHTYI